MLLLSLYTAAIVLNLARGRRDIDCGCGGPGSRQTLHEWLVWRNLAYLTLALLALPPPLDRGMEFYQRALRNNVLTVPGEFFDVNPGKRRRGPSPYRQWMNTGGRNRHTTFLTCSVTRARAVFCRCSRKKAGATG